MLNKKSMVLLLTLSFVLIFASLTSAAQYNWRYAHEEVPGSIQDRYAHEFAKRLNEKSDGKIEMQIYTIGQLGNARQIFEMVQNGAIQFAHLSPGNTGGMVPENQLFSIQFLLPENTEATKYVLNNSKALNETLSSLYLKKDIKVLSYWPEGFMQWTANKKLTSPADFKGFKMRTMPSPMIVAAYEAYGANPTPVPYMEVYSGLQLGMIQGQENPLFAIEEMKFDEVQDYLILANPSMFVTTTATNPDFFNSLPVDIQELINETVAEMQDYAFKLMKDINQDRLETIKERDQVEVIKLTEEQRAKFRKVSLPTRDKYVELVGTEDAQEIIDTLEKEIEAARKKFE